MKELTGREQGRQARKFSTTPGTRDMLPPESTRLFDVQRRVVERFRAHGFREVVTPSLEYAEVVEESAMRDVSFKLFDADNQMLLLRPEMTTPIARLVAQRLSGEPGPHKLSYSLPVYRRTSVGRAQSAEFHQAGVEVVGSASPGEDAGGISLLIDILSSLGLRPGLDFSVVLGQAGFYRDFLEERAPEALPLLIEALAGKDLVRVEEISSRLPESAAEGARGIPRIVGPASDGRALGEAERYARGRASGAFENLREVLSHLEAVGRLEGVMLDFGLIGRHGYYTGAVYEVYAAGLGFTVANGGRYDNLISRFGESKPATGFAISLERLISILPEERPGRVIVLSGSDPAASATASRLRGLGAAVSHLCEDLTPLQAHRYALSVEAALVGYPSGEGLKLARVEESGPTEFESFSLEEAARLGGGEL